VFATVRLRQRVIKGARNRTKALSMAFKLIEVPKTRWRKIRAAHLLPLIRAGVHFIDGVQLERQPNQEDRKEAA
jgi:putative transposase